MLTDKQSLAIENIETISIQGLLDWGKSLIDSQADLTFQAPSLEARLLFTYATCKSHTWIMTYGAQHALSHVNYEQINKYIHAIHKRIDGTPIAFILGTQDFWTLTLKVSNCTLIPRQDTETLVEVALNLPLPSNACVLDLGTGTGAIALSLASEKPSWRVTGIDKIKEAVELARENGRLNSVKANFLQSDWFSAIDTQSEDKIFDVIVTNPPYVEQDSEYVKQGDLRFEPLTALVSGIDGLDDIRQIIVQSIPYLNASGYLLIEHGNTQHHQVQALLHDAGFSEVESILDINQIERITLGKWDSVSPM